jgi:alkanesulfonate monooxygenase SsuD/methylene tetrahydromethanopterin reductase-like flavin-dependent oxidoreductase (luciferase family)
MGKEPLPIGQHSPGFVGSSDDEAKELVWPHYRDMHSRIGRERGWPPLAREQFDAEAGPYGALMVGSPETVAHKIARSARELGLDRFDLKYSLGTLAHEHLMESIRLYGTEVMPRVHELLAQ